MAWYWWVFSAIVVFLIGRAIVGRSKPPARNDLAEIFEPVRRRRADANRELAKVVDVIANLPVVDLQSSPGNTLLREELDGVVRNFLDSKFQLEMGTQTKMVHVVVSPTRIAVFAKLHPTKSQAAAREFMRIADQAWSFRTRQVDDMQAAINQAEQEAAREQ